MSPPPRPLIELSRVYRDAHARYAVAFGRGDVNAIEEAFSRMQELCRAFHDGARWAESRATKEKKPR
jgi:hypothetical protein